MNDTQTWMNEWKNKKELNWNKLKWIEIIKVKETKRKFHQEIKHEWMERRTNMNELKMKKQTRTNERNKMKEINLNKKTWNELKSWMNE